MSPMDDNKRPTRQRFSRNGQSDDRRQGGMRPRREHGYNNGDRPARPYNNNGGNRPQRLQ